MRGSPAAGHAGHMGGVLGWRRPACGRNLFSPDKHASSVWGKAPLAVYPRRVVARARNRLIPGRLVAIRSRVRATKWANIAGAAASEGTGTDFAHSVTIFASDIGRFVGPESVQSERVMFM